MLKRRKRDALRLIVVRHGVTEWNAMGRMQGHSDIPLSPRGILQAQAVADRLADVSLTAVYASDLSRAAETGRHIAARHGLDIVTLPELRETMLGDWEGLTDDEIVALGDGARLADYRCDPVTCRPPNSEPIEEIYRRIVAAKSLIAERHECGTVVVVGHGGSLRALFAEAIRAPVRCMFGFRLDNASISVIDYRPVRSWLTLLNDTHHLSHLEDGDAE
jgi:broad specificity phosphatase PhoE